VPPKRKTIDDSLAAMASEKRAALARLRETIRTVPREAEDWIRYGIRAFRLEGAGTSRVRGPPGGRGWRFQCSPRRPCPRTCSCKPLHAPHAGGL